MQTHSRFGKFAYLADMIFPEPSISVRFSASAIVRRIQNSIIVKLIFRASQNLKIFKVIEFLLSVFMIHVHFWRNRADKGFDYKTMDKSYFACSISVIKKYIEIAMRSSSRTQQFICEQTSHVPPVANFIAAFKIKNGFPSLRHIKERL